MPSTFVWNGLVEAQAELRQFPATLTTEATAIVERTATEAVSEIKAAYPAVTGTSLRDRTSVSRTSGNGLFQVAAVIKNTSPLASIFENGTQARHYITSKRGVIHLTGRIPPLHVFIPRVIRARRVLQSRLATMLERHGFLVRVDAD